MALQKQTITLDFGFGGIDESVDPKRLMPVKFSELKNVRFNKTGRIDRRPGVELVGDYASSTGRMLENAGGLVMARVPGEGAPPTIIRVMASGSSGGSYLTNDEFFPVAEITTAAIGQNRRAAASSTVLRYDVAYGATYYALASEFVNGSGTPTIFVEIREKDTHNLFVNHTLVAGAAPKLVANPAGGDQWVMMSFNGSTTVQYHTFSATSDIVSAYISSGVATASIGKPIASIVAAANTTSSSSAIVWTAALSNPSSLSIILRCSEWPNASGTGAALGSNTSLSTASEVIGLAFSEHRSSSAHSTTVRLSWYDRKTGGGVYSGVYSTTCTQVLAPVLVHSGTAITVSQIVGANSSSTNYLGVSVGQGTVTASTYVYQINTSNTPALMDTICGVDIASQWKGSKDTSDQVYGWFSYRSDTTQTCAILYALVPNAQYRKATACGRVFYGDGPSPISTTTYINGTPSMHNAGSNVWKTPLLRKQRVSYSGDSLGNTYDVYEVSHVSVTNGTGWNESRVRDELLLTGGLPTFISNADGPLPIGPLLAPKIISLASTTVGALTAGSYAVSGVLEFTDTDGRVHRSAPALPVTHTLSGTNVGIVTTYEAYRIPDGLFANGLNSLGRLKFIPYRTLVNESQVYYRTASSTACGASPSTTSSFSVSLSIADTTIAAEQPLYTTGGVFPDYMPSAIIAAASNGRRVLVVEADRPNFVLEGKPIVSGYGVSFMEDTGRDVQQGGSRIYGLASYLDRWFAFKSDAVLVASGDGADVTGQNDTLSEFQPFTNGLGCTEPRSIVTTDSGIVFKSKEGFVFIGSDMTTRSIGKAVEDRVGTATVIDTCYNQKTSEVSFAMSDSTLLVLTIWKDENGAIDFRWSSDDNITVSHLAVFNNKRNSLGASQIYRDSSGYVDAYAGAESVPTQRYTTAWAPMGGIQGFGRIYKALFAGNFSSTQASTTVTVQIGYDYSTTYAETHTMDSANFKRNGEAVHFEIRPQRTRCEAIRFDIQESGPASVTAGTHAPGLSMNQIQLEVGIKSGSNKLPSSAMARKA